MKGTLVALTIMGVFLLLMCLVYKRVNNRSMLKDLLDDLKYFKE